MIHSVEQLESVLDNLGFDYHTRNLRPGFGNTPQTFFVVYATPGQRKALKGLYEMIDLKLMPILWLNDHGCDTISIRLS